MNQQEKKTFRIDMVKLGLNVAAEVGIGLLAGAAAAALIAGGKSKPWQKALMVFGAAVLGGVAGSTADKWLDEQVDATVEIIDGFRAMAQYKPEEPVEEAPKHTPPHVKATEVNKNSDGEYVLDFESENSAKAFVEAYQHVISVKGFITTADLQYICSDGPEYTYAQSREGWVDPYAYNLETMTHVNNWFWRLTFPAPLSLVMKEDT